jgi:type 1 glutamine amidotransferase
MTDTSLTRRKALQLGVAATAATTLALPAQATRAEPQKALFFTKSAGFEHSVIRRVDGALGHAERVLIDVGKKQGFEVTATKDGGVFDGDLDQYAVLIFYTTGDLTTAGRDQTPAISPRGKQALLDSVRGGKGFVGIHCASDTFHSQGELQKNQEQRDPFVEMLGGEFMYHGQQQAARMTVMNNTFPGMESLGEGVSLYEEWYSLKNFASDMHVLLINETEGMRGDGYRRPRYPATWARRHGCGRVFYTSMGHREDVWLNPIFQDIIVGGIHWAMRRVDVDIPPNIARVTPQADVLPPS